MVLCACSLSVCKPLSKGLEIDYKMSKHGKGRRIGRSECIRRLGYVSIKQPIESTEHDS